MQKSMKMGIVCGMLVCVGCAMSAGPVVSRRIENGSETGKRGVTTEYLPPAGYPPELYDMYLRARESKIGSLRENNSPQEGDDPNVPVGASGEHH